MEVINTFACVDLNSRRCNGQCFARRYRQVYLLRGERGDHEAADPRETHRYAGQIPREIAPVR